MIRVCNLFTFHFLLNSYFIILKLFTYMLFRLFDRMRGNNFSGNGGIVMGYRGGMFNDWSDVVNYGSGLVDNRSVLENWGSMLDDWSSMLDDWSCMLNDWIGMLYYWSTVLDDRGMLVCWLVVADYAL